MPRLGCSYTKTFEQRPTFHTVAGSAGKTVPEQQQQKMQGNNIPHTHACQRAVDVRMKHINDWVLLFKALRGCSSAQNVFLTFVLNQDVLGIL